jgi:hypothetical protein
MSTSAARQLPLRPPKPVASGLPPGTTGGEKVEPAASLAPEEEIIPSKPAGVRFSIAGESALLRANLTKVNANESNPCRSQIDQA